MRVRAHVWSFPKSVVHRVHIPLFSLQIPWNHGCDARLRVPYLDSAELRYGTHPACALPACDG